MLPFLKKRQEGGMSGPVETLERSPDEGSEESYGIIDAIAEDMKQGRFKEAIEALCDYLKAEDVEQDSKLTGDMS